MSKLRYLVLTGTAPDPELGWLTSRERAIDERIRHDKPRTDWRLGRWAGKTALALAAGIGTDTKALRRIQILPKPTGAPRAMLDGLPSPWALSLSHSADSALCALTPAGAVVGCDIECIDFRSAAFVETFFTDAEAEAWVAAPESERDLLATLVWSAKESALKVLEEGLRMDTRAVEVSVGDATRVGDGTQGGGWSPLSVAYGKGSCSWDGWWRQESRFVLTVLCTRAPAEEPVALRR